MTDLLHFRVPWGIALWPPDHLASIRVESTGRFQALSTDDEIAWRPGPVSDVPVPLVEVAPGTWVPRRRKRSKAAPLRVGRRLIPFEDVRGIRAQGSSRPGSPCRLLHAGGPPITLTRDIAARLRADLRIPSLDYLEHVIPAHLGLYRLGLREFLPDLRYADAPTLNTLLGSDERALTANVVWQAYLAHCDGRGTSHRGRIGLLAAVPSLARACCRVVNGMSTMWAPLDALSDEGRLR